MAKVQSATAGKLSFVAAKLGAAAAWVGVFWLGVCALACAWLAFKVPVTAQDIAYASWLGSYAVATYPRGALVFALGGTCLFVGYGVAVAKSSPMMFVPGGVLGVSVLMAASQGTIVRVGVAFDSVKIGCYVYESRECREMLGVPIAGALSRYASDDERARGEANAGWYEEARAPRSASLLDSIPGGYLVRAPLLIGKEAELNLKIAAQREEYSNWRTAMTRPQQ